MNIIKIKLSVTNDYLEKNIWKNTKIAQYI